MMQTLETDMDLRITAPDFVCLRRNIDNNLAYTSW